ncbi:MAG TPA: CBS domain-containing protein [Streptomyces sp.]|nr:CBS domain-containing protein [Streptomyces sp.]
MPYRSVGELMASPGIAVHRGTGLEEVAGLLAEHAITAVPVVDEDECPVGIVSKADLRQNKQRRQGATASGTQPELRYGQGAPGNPGDRTGREPATAGEVMTSPAVTARPEWTVVEAVRTMERRRVKRLPVVNEAEQLLGFLGRADVLRVFLRRDRAVREEITAEVLDRTLGLGPSQVTVTVTDGRVTLQGIVDHRDLLPVVDRLTLGVDGVVEVRNHLAYRTATPRGRAPDGQAPSGRPPPAAS